MNRNLDLSDVTNFKLDSHEEFIVEDYKKELILHIEISSVDRTKYSSEVEIYRLDDGRILEEFCWSDEIPFSMYVFDQMSEPHVLEANINKISPVQVMWDDMRVDILEDKMGVEIAKDDARQRIKVYYDTAEAIANEI